MDEVMNLYVQFDSLRNDMKFRCENLQTAIINMEEMKQLDRVKQAEALAAKDATIA
jgi:hypothetical protein